MLVYVELKGSAALASSELCCIAGACILMPALKSAKPVTFSSCHTGVGIILFATEAADNCAVASLDSKRVLAFMMMLLSPACLFKFSPVIGVMISDISSVSVLLITFGSAFSAVT